MRMSGLTLGLLSGLLRTRESGSSSSFHGPIPACGTSNSLICPQSLSLPICDKGAVTNLWLRKGWKEKRMVGGVSARGVRGGEASGSLPAPGLSLGRLPRETGSGRDGAQGVSVGAACKASWLRQCPCLREGCEGVGKESSPCQLTTWGCSPRKPGQRLRLTTWASWVGLCLPLRSDRV